MTEAALSSVPALEKHLSTIYKLQLTDRQTSDLKLLLENDKETLCSILYTLENTLETIRRRLKKKEEREKEMKRKSQWFRSLSALSRSPQSPVAANVSEDDKNIFLEQIERAAKRHRDELDESDTEQYEEARMDDSLDQTYSIDEIIANISESLPSSSKQITSSHASKMTSIATSPQLSELTTPSSSPGNVPKRDIVSLAEAKDLHPSITHSRLSQIPYWVKYFLTFVVNRGSISWAEVTIEQADALSMANDEASISEAMLQIHPGVSKHVTKELVKACYDMKREEMLLDAGETYLADAQSKWFGGKVRLSGTLSKSEDGVLQIVLQAPSTQTSCQLTRRFGSHRLLRLALPKGSARKVSKKDIEQYLQSDIRVMDCCYRLFLMKDERSAYTCQLFMVDEDIPDIWSLYNFHSPWQDNSDQLLCKYLSRMQLCLSASTPCSFIPAENIRRVPDIVSPEGAVMTDGASAISREAMRGIVKQLDLPAVPSAIQGRFNGCKGMWYTSPDDNDDKSMWISIRGSQEKIKRHQVEEVCHQTLDVLCVSRSKTPSAIGKQIIPILTCNGVPHSAIFELQRLQVNQLVADILGDEVDPNDGIVLAKKLESAGNIAGSRARKVAPDREAAIGEFSRAARDFAEDAALKAAEEDVDKDGDSEEAVLSKSILSSCEKAYMLLLSGFLIKSSLVTSDEVMQAVKALLDRSKDRIVVQRSVERPIIPDPLGVLEEGEIQVRFGSDAPIDPESMIALPAVLGDVLITRLPCLIPTDIRKVKAVIHPRLSLYTNEIIVSTKGDRSVADMLSGGDFDGDTASVYWEPLLVDPFVNADLNKCQPSITLEDAFDRDISTVSDLFEGRLGGDREGILESLITSPLTSYSNKGALGNLHSVAAYQHGCDSQVAIDMAFKFNNNMDGAKTGYKLKAEVFKADKYLFDRQLPSWGPRNEGAYNNLPSQRDKDLGSFILDELEIYTNRVLDQVKAGLQKREKKATFQGDCDVASLWKEAEKLSSLTPLQQLKMKDYCKDVLKQHRDACAIYWREKERSEPRSASSSPRKQYREISRPAIRNILTLDDIPAYFERWAMDQEWCKSFSGCDILDTCAKDRIRKILTSCLYIQSRIQCREKASFEIAFSTILQIKAEVQSKKPNSLFNTTSYPQHVNELLRLNKRAIFAAPP